MPAAFLGDSYSAPPDRCGVAVVPVPFDATACYRGGAREGPGAIIAASPHMELYDEDVRCEAWRWGIHTDVPVEPVMPPDALAAAVEERTGQWLAAGVLPVLLGGDHSVSIGAIRAAASRSAGLLVVQFDAHTDLRDSYQGTRFSHACVMRRASEVAEIVQVGIRSTSSAEVEFMEANGMEPIWAREVVGDFQAALDRLLGGVEDRDIYLTIDLDVLDPSIMPSVGTPEPGGLGWYHLVDMLAAIVERARVVGFDVVELAPVPGLHAPDYLAARLVYKLLALIYSVQARRF